VTALAAEHPEGAVSAAYYAMSYAARGALSEDDRHAKTHTGTWAAFGETFVASGRFDRTLAGEAARTQRLREDVDYDAARISAARAQEVIDVAQRSVAASEGLVGA
jgi:uncharacterized protein (UPF0332 family)